MSDGIDATRSIVAGHAVTEGYLLVIQDGSSSVCPLPPSGRVLIGRVPEAQLRLTDGACSRRHAVVVVDDRGAQLEDLGSHNGTRINGQRVSGTQALVSGDVIAIGEVVIVLHRGGHNARGIALLDPAAFQLRLEEEIARSIAYERPVSIIALAPMARAEEPLASLVATSIALIGCATVAGDGYTLVLLPEIDPDTATEEAQQVLRACDGGRAGVASCPTDGCNAEALIAAARTAAGQADTGVVTGAADAAERFTFGARTAVVADPAMRQLFQLLARLAPSDLPVLVTGETGAGKENAAYALHAWSKRASQPLIAVNCAALQESLADSELFGHERGAFSGAVATKIGLLEAADKGTVFLDELGELPLAIQAKLLRALEVGEITRVGSVKAISIDVRLVAATNRDLEADVASGRFRQDLLFRLGAARVALPPLRDRPRELALLARTFLDEARAAAGRPPLTLSSGAMDVLDRHAWPGNVRELRNEMRYIAATVDDVVVERRHLSARLAGLPDAAPTAPSSARAMRPIDEELRELERRRMVEALEAARGVQKHAAELIMMPLRTFRMKSRQYGIDRLAPRR